MAMARKIEADLEVNVVIRASSNFTYLAMKIKFAFLLFNYLLVQTCLGQITMEKEMSVRVDETLDIQKLNIVIATVGWHSIKSEIFKDGQMRVENIPNEAGLYVLQISYGDTLVVSRVFVHEVQKCKLSFQLLEEKSEIICKIWSSAHIELNTIVRLTDIQSDSADLVAEFRRRLN